jgi:DNA-binding transcriptional LysR family regulator
LRLHISQPALSRQIQEVQQDLKLRLFERVGRWLVLTTEGQQLLESCRSVLSDAQALSEHAQQLRRGDAGVMRVVATAHIETTSSKFLPQFARLYPNVEVKLIESSGVVLAMVERGDVHVGLTATDPAAIDGSRIGIYPVMHSVFVASRPSFPLKAQ